MTFDRQVGLLTSRWRSGHPATLRASLGASQHAGGVLAMFSLKGVDIQRRSWILMDI